MDRLTDAVIQGLKAAPCSLRALARTAGVSHVQLLHITQGKRRATLAVARRVARALEQWGETCGRAATRIHHAEPRRTR